METTHDANKKRELEEKENDEKTLKKTVSNENRAYKKTAGSLLHLANATRPDTSYSINVLRGRQMNLDDDDEWRQVE